MIANYTTPNERSDALDAILSVVFETQWLVFLIVAGVLLAFTELGFFAGLRIHRTRDEPRKAVISGIQASVLALLGLLLGFTFSMSLSRFETRRDLVMEEANAIGTTYLRSSFLAPKEQAEFKRLLKEYIHVRVSFYEAGASRSAVEEAEVKTEALQDKLWETAVAGTAANPTALTGTFINALNETIDLDSERSFALENKVPSAVWILVLVVACAGCFASGYTAGANGAHSALVNIMLPLLLTTVITLIADMDRPRRGLVGISQKPMIKLKTIGQKSIPDK